MLPLHPSGLRHRPPERNASPAALSIGARGLSKEIEEALALVLDAGSMTGVRALQTAIAWMKSRNALTLAGGRWRDG